MRRISGGLLTGDDGVGFRGSFCITPFTANPYDFSIFIAICNSPWFVISEHSHIFPSIIKRKKFLDHEIPPFQSMNPSFI